MKQFYRLVIRDNKYRNYKKLSSLLFLINAFFFGFLALRSSSISTRIILFCSAFILLLYSVYNWAYKKKKEKSYGIVYLLVAAVWITDTAYWPLAVLFLLLLFLQYRMESDFTISFSDQTVIVSGFTKKQYPWSDFDNIVLKDELLTLDFKNNRILQVEPDWNAYLHKNGRNSLETYPRTEKEFNEFCGKQLEIAHRSTPAAPDA